MLIWRWLCVLRRRSLMAASSLNEEGCHRGRLDVLFNVCRAGRNEHGMAFARLRATRSTLTQEVL